MEAENMSERPDWEVLHNIGKMFVFLTCYTDLYIILNIIRKYSELKLQQNFSFSEVD